MRKYCGHCGKNIRQFSIKCKRLVYHEHCYENFRNRSNKTYYSVENNFKLTDIPYKTIVHQTFIRNVGEAKFSLF